MKKNRRTISLLLALCMVLVSSLSFGACKKEDEAKVDMGLWLSMIANAFGMETYTSKEPYFDNIDETNPYFTAVQAAVEWEILDENMAFSTEDILTYNEALITLVNAGEFLGEDASEKEKIAYGIENFDSSIRGYWGKRDIPFQRAAAMLEKASVQWRYKTYTDCITEVAFEENVCDLADSDISYTRVDDTVTLENGEGLNLSLKEGDVYTLPATEDTPSSINRVKTITYENGRAVIVNDPCFTQEDALESIQELKIQETETINFDRIIGIYDEDGNPILYKKGSKEGNANTSFDWNSPKPASTIPCTPDMGKAKQTGFFDNVGGEISFELKNGWSVTASGSSNSFGLEVAKKLGEKENAFRTNIKSAFVSGEFSDVELTNDIDYSWGTLHEATVRLDYTFMVEGGVRVESTGDCGKIGEGANVKSSLKEVLGQYKNTFQSLSEGIQGNTEKEEIYICKIRVLGNKLASVDFIVKGQVTVTGEVKLVMELAGSNGFQYKNGNLRIIKGETFRKSISADANLEVTIGPGIQVSLFDKINLADFTIDAGLGFHADVKMNMVDAEFHRYCTASAVITDREIDDFTRLSPFVSAEDVLAFAQEEGGSWKNYKGNIGGTVALYPCICFEWDAYPILRFGIGEESLVSKLANAVSQGGVKVDGLKMEILGEDDTFIKGHIDIGKGGLASLTGSIGSDMLGKDAECSYAFTPWDDIEEELDEEDSEDESQYREIEGSEGVRLSTYAVTLKEGETSPLRITGIPDGIALGDLVVTSSDSSVAVFDLPNGRIVAKSPGYAFIEVAIPNGTKVKCGVTVLDSTVPEYTGLSEGNL